jgi:cytochrome P450
MTRYRDVELVLRDRRFGKNFIGRVARRLGEKALGEPVYQMMSRQMLVLDPPDHTRLRGLVVKAFTARRIEAMRFRIQEIVDQLIDAVLAGGCMDVIRDFAFPLPVTVICDMLGIPPDEREQFINQSHISGRLLDPIPLTRQELDFCNNQTLFLSDYFHRLFDLRRRQPGDDLTTMLVQAEEAGQTLSEEELISNIILLFGAGHETTVNLIGNGLLALHRNRTELERLKRHPEMMPDAIEELLRYDSSVQMTGRMVQVDTEFDGAQLRAGDSVIVLIGAANRDPAVYLDPDRLDLSRSGERAISFGGGIHHCLGAQLARIEGEIALETLLRRLPALQLDDVERPEWRPTFALRGLKTLPAHW